MIGQIKPYVDKFNVPHTHTQTFKSLFILIYRNFHFPLCDYITATQLALPNCIVFVDTRADFEWNKYFCYKILWRCESRFSFRLLHKWSMSLLWKKVFILFLTRTISVSFPQPINSPTSMITSGHYKYLIGLWVYYYSACMTRWILLWKCHLINFINN